MYVCVHTDTHTQNIFHSLIHIAEIKYVEMKHMHSMNLKTGHARRRLEGEMQVLSMRESKCITSIGGGGEEDVYMREPVRA